MVVRRLTLGGVCAVLLCTARVFASEPIQALAGYWASAGPKATLEELTPKKIERLSRCLPTFMEIEVHGSRVEMIVEGDIASLVSNFEMATAHTGKETTTDLFIKRNDPKPALIIRSLAGGEIIAMPYSSSNDEYFVKCTNITHELTP